LGRGALHATEDGRRKLTWRWALFLFALVQAPLIMRAETKQGEPGDDL
jgi:hypothetical protein